ncbi:hypothetical protein BC834DRAFT_169467 [Gloeopeniophorella convolvens]|nr:hypothetical protein BC834DRAFT_169467 [Gloeopeniophorella convolvens]
MASVRSSVPNAGSHAGRLLSSPPPNDRCLGFGVPVRVCLGGLLRRRLLLYRLLAWPRRKARGGFLSRTAFHPLRHNPVHARKQQCHWCVILLLNGFGGSLIWRRCRVLPCGGLTVLLTSSTSYAPRVSVSSFAHASRPCVLLGLLRITLDKTMGHSTVRRAPALRARSVRRVTAWGQYIAEAPEASSKRAVQCHPPAGLSPSAHHTISSYSRPSSITIRCECPWRNPASHLH